MNRAQFRSTTFVSALVLAAFGLVTPAHAQDAAAATALLKKNECTKCHSIDKEKKGPSYKKVAEKYKGKADAEAKITKFVSSSPKVKLDDGTEEEHKVLKGDDAAKTNLIKYILAQ
jgi:cytochrome c